MTEQEKRRIQTTEMKFLVTWLVIVYEIKGEMNMYGSNWNRNQYKIVVPSKGICKLQTSWQEIREQALSIHDSLKRSLIYMESCGIESCSTLHSGHRFSIELSWHTCIFLSAHVLCRRRSGPRVCFVIKCSAACSVDNDKKLSNLM